MKHLILVILACLLFSCNKDECQCSSELEFCNEQSFCEAHDYAFVLDGQLDDVRGMYLAKKTESVLCVDTIVLDISYPNPDEPYLRFRSKLIRPATPAVFTFEKNSDYVEFQGYDFHCSDYTDLLFNFKAKVYPDSADVLIDISTGSIPWQDSVHFTFYKYDLFLTR